MDFFDALFQNKILITAVIAWACSQCLKVLTFYLVNHRLDIKRLTGDGGMPSSHSAFVTSAAVATGFECGWSSPIFAIACIFAFIVMHDAKGVRYETGKQAKVLNELLEYFQQLSDKEITPDEALKEFVGHTPLQVLMGFFLGIAVACAVNL